MSAFPTADVYAQALALNGSAFADGHYEVAFHLLMTALHCAEDLGDADRLAEVSGVAGAQQRDLDRAAPAHRLASRSAHGPRGVFDMAAVTAGGARQRVESDRWIAAHRSRPTQ
jgi:hypothetical protein